MVNLDSARNRYAHKKNGEEFPVEVGLGYAHTQSGILIWAFSMIERPSRTLGIDAVSQPIHKIDEHVKSRISDGFVKSARSRLAGRESELRRANGKSIKIITANLYVPS